MKKFLLIVSAFLLCPMTARAGTCPSGQYWNSIDQKCDSCQKKADYTMLDNDPSQCLECKEAFTGKYSGSLYPTKSANSKSYPICTKLKSDAYYVDSNGSVASCRGRASCSTDHCTSSVSVSSATGTYTSFVTCKDGCTGNWYSYYLTGTCLVPSGNCTKVAGDGKNGLNNSHNGKSGFYCTQCYSGYTLITENGYFGAINTKCCKGEHVADCNKYGNATTCEDGYTLTNGSCVMAAPSCTDGQYADSTGKCQSCSNISVTNGTCSACSSDGACTNATCDKGYAYNASTSACTPVVTCKPPLKFSADYSGDCDGCCVE